MSYQIKLPQFEGPFDLLLFFIERDELDIYDIPISEITDEFLGYVRMMESMNIDLASEFILVAATLMRIKAKMLLPRKEIDESGNEIDPREELVRRLVEYKKIKSVLEDLHGLEEDRAKKINRGNVRTEIRELATAALIDVELETLNLFKLMQRFEEVMTQYEDEITRPKHEVVRFDYSLEECRDRLYTTIKGSGKIIFEKLFTFCENRMHAIFTFLAMLELLQMPEIGLLQGEGENNFWLTYEPE